MDAPRFDAVAKALAAHAPRRTLLKLLAALGLGGAAAGRSADRARARTCYDCCPICCSCGLGGCCCCGGGIAGAGVVLAAGVGAPFTLFATRVAEAEATEPVRGHLRWSDPFWQGPAGDRGLVLASEQVADYGPLTGEEEQGREVRGLARVNDQDDVPFLLHAIAGAAVGGEDRVRLWVGDAIPAELGPPARSAGFGYAAEGALVVGSLALLRFDEPATGTPVP